MSQELQWLDRCPEMSKEEFEKTFALFRLTKDAMLQRQLAEANLRLVAKVAWEIPNRHGWTISDLVAWGTPGLYRAIELFDPRDGAFSTYASIWIWQSITHELKTASLLRPYSLSPTTIGNMATLSGLIASFARREGHEPSFDELLKFCAKDERKSMRTMTPRRLYRLLRLLAQAPAENQWDDSVSPGVECEEMLAPSFKDPLSYCIEKQERERLNGSIMKLKPTYQEVLKRRNGFYTDEGETLESIGRSKGVSREAVRRLESRASQNLRELYEARV